jgi:hypothetical protein
MKPRSKPNGKRSPKSARPITDQQLVERLTAAGLNGDIVAQVVGINKNRLRARFAAALYSGRKEAEKQKAAEANDALTRTEMHAANAILGAINSHWHTPQGNLLYRGLHNRDAQSAPEAYAAWLLNGGHWNCSGLATNFSDAQVAEFVALKRAAEELLKDFPRVSLWSPTAATCQRSNSRPR